MLTDIGGDLQLLVTIATLLVSGALAGLLAGLLGVGGGIIIVPILFTFLPLMDVAEPLQMHIAVATSLATIIFTSASSVWAHYQQQAIDIAIARQLIPALLFGAILGGTVGGRVSSVFLIAVFAFIAFAIALYILFVDKETKVSNKVPTGFIGHISGSCIGCLSVLMGIGGGTIGVPFLHLCSVPIRTAVATASSFGLVIAIPGVISLIYSGWSAPNLPFGNVGYVNLFAVAIIAPMSTLLAPFGAKLAHRIPPAYLRRIFALFLLITSLRMFMSLW